MSYTAQEARKNFRTLLDDAQAGRQSTITRHGLPVAAVLPMTPDGKIIVTAKMPVDLRLDEDEVPEIRRRLSLAVEKATEDAT